MKAAGSVLKRRAGSAATRRTLHLDFSAKLQPATVPLSAINILSTSDSQNDSDSPDTLPEPPSLFHKLRSKLQWKRSRSNTSEKSYWHLWSDADKLTKLYMIIGTIGGFLNGAVPPLINLIIGGLINVVQAYEREYPNYKGDLLQELLFFVYCLIAMAVGGFIAGYLQTYCWIVAAERQTKKIRERYFRAVVMQELRFFDENPSGEMASRMTNDLNLMYDGMAEKVGYIIQFGTSFILGVLLAFVTSWQLTLILLACFPIPAIALNRMWNQVSINAEKIQKAYSHAGALAFSAFRSITTVMINNAQFEEEDRYANLLIRAYQVARKINIVNAIGVGIVTFFFYAVRTIVFYLGGLLVLAGSLSGGNAVGTFLQLSSGVMYLGNLFSYFQATNEAQGAGQKVFEVIESKPTISTSNATGIILPEFKGGIEFKNVSFAYPTRPDTPILRNLSFKVEPGQTVGLVGASGCGKSTIFQLLLRLYDVDDGEILFDGVNIKDLNLLWLRETMSLVSQEPILFDGTIAENVAYGASSKMTDLQGGGDRVFNVPRELIEKACESANAMEFARRFENGLDTYIARGTALSGGQKQRVAIARAIVRSPSILMLDEATSALDSKSERVVQLALDTLSKSQTTLVIAHRLTTVRNADVIMVIDAGVLIEVGTHDSLMAAKGAYSAMITAQQGEGGSEDISAGFSGEESSSELNTTNKNAILEETGISDEGEKVTEGMSMVKRLGSMFRRKSERTIKNEEVALTKVPSHPNLEVEIESDSSNKSGDELTPEGKRSLEEKQHLIKRPFPAKRLWGIVRQDIVFVVVGLVGSVFDGFLVPLEASLMALNIGIYSDPVRYGGHDAILLYSMLFIPLSVLALFAKSLQQYGFGIAGARLTERIRAQAFSRVVTMDMYFFDKERHSAGELSSRLAADADAVKRVGGLLIGQMITLVINSTVGMGIAFYAGWQLTLVMIGLAPLLFIATFLERKVLEGFTDSTKKAYEKSSQLASFVLSNIKTVIVLAKEHLFSENYSVSLIEPHNLGIKKAVIRAIGTGVFQSLMIITYLGAFLFCYFLIVNRILMFAAIGTVILNVLLTSVAAGALAAAARSFTDAKIAAIALFELIDEKPRIEVDPDLSLPENQKKRRRSNEGLARDIFGNLNVVIGTDIDVVADDIVNGKKSITDLDIIKIDSSSAALKLRLSEDGGLTQSLLEVPFSGPSISDSNQPLLQLNNVEFSFPSRPDSQVLRGVSIKVWEGTKIALVGGSGSGKSTIASLIQRLYEPTGGAILFRGTDLRDWDLISLRSQMGVVGQEPILFDRTIEENIKYGLTDATFEDVQEAAMTANIHEFIMKLPNGYATPVGDMGGRLSGGQKQRVAIARALIRKPKLLILDEATSALDSETEQLVDAALGRAAIGRTTIAIAHRLQSIQDADVIYVLESGTVAESGSHSELMAKKSLYYSMVIQQTMSNVLADSKN